MGKGKKSKGMAPRNVRKALREARKNKLPIDKFSATSKLRRKLDASQAITKGSRWPKLFRQHFNVIESHIKVLDRVVRNMHGLMRRMEDEEEKAKWESGEVGGVVLLNGFRERAVQVFESAKAVEKFVMGEALLNDGKAVGGRGSMGSLQTSNSMPQDLTSGATIQPQSTMNQENNGDIEMSDASDEDTVPTPFVPVNLSLKTSKSKVNGNTKDTNSQATGKVEPNPYFVVDTEPTPVVMNDSGSTPKNSKKRVKEVEAGTPEKKVKKAKKSKVVTPPSGGDETTTPENGSEGVNFHTLQAELQAEVEAAMRARVVQGAAEGQVEEGDGKKEKKKKRRRSEISEGSGEVGEEVVEKRHKKEKKEKREKKRKAEESADAEVATPESSKKKKRRHREHVEE